MLQVIEQAIWLLSLMDTPNLSHNKIAGGHFQIAGSLNKINTENAKLRRPPVGEVEAVSKGELEAQEIERGYCAFNL